jgi:outer membrane protein OmpU
MKKVLFATTALVASAGFAAADVSLSGSAEMGVIGGTERDTQFHTDIDVTFTMSGETDNGLTFGASIDLDESTDGDAFGNTTQGGETIFISGGPHTFTMGDTDGAFDANMIEVPIGGDIDDVVEHAGYSGQAGLDGYYDGQIARYDYSFDAFTVSFSVELPFDDVDSLAFDLDGDGTDDDVFDFSGDPVYGIGASYEFGDFEVGIGYQWVSWDAEVTATGADADDPDVGDVFDVSESILGISGAYSMGDITVGANYSVGDAEIDVTGDSDLLNLDYTQFGIGAAYSMDAWTFAANYGMQKVDASGTLITGDDEGTNTGFGIAVHYDLGGGAVVQFGYGWSDSELGDLDGVGALNDAEAFDDFSVTDGESSAWSLGVAMSF